MNRNFYTSLALMSAIALGLIAIYAMVIFTTAKADSPRVGGEIVLFVTMQDGPGEETLFGGSFPNHKACITYAKAHYPIDGRRWIAYKCIHEELHEYLESKKEIRVNI